MNSFDRCLLYGFIDSAYLNGRNPAALAADLCRGGADAIQLRMKGAAADQVEAVAREVLPVTRSAGVPLVINDHLSVAKAAGAEGCHLGQEDFLESGAQDVAALCGDTSLALGLSTHSPAEALKAIAAGAHYLGVGPVFPTGTKPTALPVTLEYVSWAAANVKIPWFAIGGITMSNIDQIMAAGARRICVVSAILNRKDVAAAAGEFKQRLLQAPLNGLSEAPS